MLGVSKLTILQGVLTDLIRHTTGSHWHVSHDVEAVIPSRLKVIDNVAGCVVADHNLVFFVVQT